MASDKAMYMIAVAVLAVGLGNSYFEKHPGGIDALTSRSTIWADQVTARAESYVSLADAYLSRGDATLSRSEDAMSRVESRMSMVQATMSRRQAEISRRQVEKMRSVMVRIPAQKFACPELQKTVTVNVADVDSVDDDVQ